MVIGLQVLISFHGRRSKLICLLNMLKIKEEIFIICYLYLFGLIGICFHLLLSGKKGVQGFGW